MGNNAPLVSVVIPAYNHAHFLTESLASVRAQTLQDWEAIVVDNHSADNTAEVVAGFGDSRISRVLIHNEGVISASRNLGMALAKGRYIAFLDADDVWHPEKLARCIARLEADADVVCHGERWVSAKKIRTVEYGPEARARYERLLFEGNCISTSAVVLHRDWFAKVGGFSTERAFITAEDYDYWLKLARAGARIRFLPDSLGEYRIHEGNQTKAVLRNMEAVKAVVESHIAALPDKSFGHWILARRRRGIVYYSGARGLQDRAEYRAAWPWFAKAVMTWPFSAKFYISALFNAAGRSVR